MNTFNRSQVFAATAAAVQSTMANTLVRSIGLCQLVLNGDITEQEQLQLVNLTEKPATDDKLAYEKFKYAARLIREAREVTGTTQAFKDCLMALDVTNPACLNRFQVEQAIQGHYLTTAESFNRLIVKHLTEETKAAKAEKAAKVQGTKAAKATKTAKPQLTATATAKTDQATVAAIQHDTTKRDVVGDMLGDLVQADDMISQFLKSHSHSTAAETLAAMAQAWRDDRAQLQAQIDQLTAEKHKATAPRQRRAA